MTPTSACLATLGSWVTTATSAARRWPDAVSVPREVETPSVLITSPLLGAALW